MIDISVIVPIYNVEKYLARCLDSILLQNFSGSFEAILVDDGSTDASKAIALEYVNDHPRVFKLLCQNNAGPGSARNLGLDYASGTYIAFVDSDDYLDTSFLTRLHTLAEDTNSDISMCSSNVCKGDDGVGAIYDTGFKENFVSENIREILFRSSFSPWGKLYKKNLFSGFRFPVGITYEDFALIPQVMYKARRIAYVSDVLYHYYVNAHGIIMSKSEDADYCILDAQSILEKSDLGNDKQLMGIFFIRRVLCTMCFSLLSNNDDLHYVKSIVKDGKSKFDLRRSLPYVQLGFIHKVFADLLVSEHYAAAYLWAKSIKCLRKAFSLLR